MIFCTKLIHSKIYPKIFKVYCKKVLDLNYVKSEINHVCCSRFLSSNTFILRPVLSRENFIPFDQMVEQRRSEARRSIVVEIKKEDEVSELEAICSKFGNIKSIAEFEPPSRKRMIIVEFEEETALNNVIQKTQINSNGHDFGAIQIPFLRLNNQKLLSERNIVESRASVISSKKSLSFQDSISSMTDKCNSISEQMQHYYESQAMTELGWRLRFLTCRKMEWVLPAVLSHVRIIPFGSSVNTFGNNNCDLDMIIDTSKSPDTKVDPAFPFLVQSDTASYAGNTQGNLEVFANLLSFYMPGCSKINRILRARVPILRFNEIFTGLECDITAGNKSGFYMSELLYLYGCSDPRVRPLVFCIRLWAKERKLTRKNLPGMWFSNFTMTTLVLYYLMNTSSGAVIPTIEALEKLSDRSHTCEGISYSFTENIEHFPLTENTLNLEELLEDFFNFYSNFNYKNGLSIVTGAPFMKPMNSALYIQNPVERELNVSRNVNLEQLESFQEECLSSLYKFDTFKAKSKSGNIWGLPAILSISNQSDSRRKSLRNVDLDFIFDREIERTKEINKEELSKVKAKVQFKVAKQLKSSLTYSDNSKSPSISIKSSNSKSSSDSKSPWETIKLVSMKRKKDGSKKSRGLSVPTFKF